MACWIECFHSLMAAGQVQPSVSCHSNVSNMAACVPSKQEKQKATESGRHSLTQCKHRSNGPSSPSYSIGWKQVLYPAHRQVDGLLNNVSTREPGKWKAMLESGHHTCPHKVGRRGWGACLELTRERCCESLRPTR